LSWDACFVTNLGTALHGSGAGAQLRIVCDDGTVFERVVLTVKTIDVTEFRTSGDRW